MLIGMFLLRRVPDRLSEPIPVDEPTEPLAPAIDVPVGGIG
jgi:hypothetical protein